MKAVKLQGERDTLIQQLIGEMDESCKAAQDAAPLRDSRNAPAKLLSRF